MGKTAVEIVQEAPVSVKYDEKLAFYCTDCPWWTNNWKDCKAEDRKEGHVAVCPKCDTPLKEAPLEWFISQHRSMPSPDYAKFIACFNSNEHWNKAA